MNLVYTYIGEQMRIAMRNYKWGWFVGVICYKDYIDLKI